MTCSWLRNSSAFNLMHLRSEVDIIFLIKALLPVPMYPCTIILLLFLINDIALLKSFEYTFDIKSDSLSKDSGRGFSRICLHISLESRFKMSVDSRLISLLSFSFFISSSNSLLKDILLPLTTFSMPDPVATFIFS